MSQEQNTRNVYIRTISITGIPAIVSSSTGTCMEDKGAGEMDAEILSGTTSAVDELQLAALLGKSLLKRNNELEQNLRRLQEFAEETMSTNQALNRHVTELRSSLQFSNTSCEQLEQKVEELEHSNKQLQKLCNIQQTLLAQKTSTFVDLQKDFARLKCQHEQLLQVKMTVEETDAGGFEAEQKRRSKNLKSDDGGKPLSIGDGSDVAELQSSMAELAQSVQNITFQKQKVESELEEVVNDNQSLVKALERADSEIVELQTRLRNVEENSLDLTSPKSRSCPLTDTQQFSPSNDPKSPLTLHKACKSPRKSGSDQDACLSLFSELDIQYSTLQQRYCELVEQCTCSASLFHKKWFPSKPENPPTNVQMVTDAPFKELFDEVFATLKQTSLVADKLIERKNTAK